MALAVGFVAIAVAVVGYGIRVTGGTAPRPTSPRSETHRASRDRRHHHPAGRTSAAPAVVIAAGHSDWCCHPSRSPSDRCCSGSITASTSPIPAGRLGAHRRTGGACRHDARRAPRAATTGIAAGALLLITAAAGFHDLARELQRAARSVRSGAVRRPSSQDSPWHWSSHPRRLSPLLRRATDRSIGAVLRCRADADRWHRSREVRSKALADHRERTRGENPPQR